MIPESYVVGVDFNEFPGKAMVTKVSISREMVDLPQGGPEIDLGARSLQPGVPGYGDLARIVHDLLSTPEGGAPLGAQNKVQAWDMAAPHIATIHQMIHSRRINIDRVEMGEHLLMGAVREIFHWQDNAIEPDFVGQFDTFADYLSNGAVLTSASGVSWISVDARGRRCYQPGDFLRASQDGAYPVRYFHALKERLWLPRVKPQAPAPSPPATTAAEPSPVPVEVKAAADRQTEDGPGAAASE